MQNAKLKWIALVLAPSFLAASLSNLVANRASGRLDDAAKLELGSGASPSPETASFKPARRTRLLLPVAMDRAEEIRALLRKGDSRVLDELQTRVGVQRP